MSTPFEYLAIPNFAVTVDGQALETGITVHVASLHVDQRTELPGTFSIELVAVEDDCTWLDSERPFAIGSEVEISLGHIGQALQPAFVGDITALDADFGGGMSPRLTVRGYDRRHRLQRGRSVRTYSKMKDSEIASRIAQQAGLAAEVTDTKLQHDYLVQANQTDFEFLQQRAQQLGFELLIDRRKLLFRPIGHLAAPVLTLSMADGGLSEFRVQIGSTGQLSETSVRGWDMKQKKSIVSTARAGQLAAMGGRTGAAMVAKRFGPAPALTAAQPVTSLAEADQIALATLERTALQMVRAEGRCPGTPALQAGKVIEVKNTSPRFDGRYYVVAAEHRLVQDSGYTTRFSAWRNSA